MSVATNVVQGVDIHPQPARRHRCLHLTQGRNIAGCTLTKHLATGPNSIVWGAKLGDQDVVVKVAAQPDDPDERHAIETAIFTEVDAHRIIGEHKGLARVFDATLVDGVPASIQELVPGHLLTQVLYGNDRMHWREAVILFAQLADTLAAIHAHRLVHRDFKPGNIMVDGGHAKLLDLASARIVGDSNFDENGYIPATPAYVAPEAVYGDLVRTSADIYSWAAALYHLIQGRPPFRGHDVLETCSMARRQTPPPLSLGTPDWLCAIIELGLSHNPRMRPTAVELKTTLRYQLAYC